MQSIDNQVTSFCNINGTRNQVPYNENLRIYRPQVQGFGLPRVRRAMHRSEREIPTDHAGARYPL